MHFISFSGKVLATIEFVLVQRNTKASSVRDDDLVDSSALIRKNYAQTKADSMDIDVPLKATEDGPSSAQDPVSLKVRSCC